MDVTVEDFTDIKSLKFTIQYDPSVLQNPTISGIGLPGMTVVDDFIFSPEPVYPRSLGRLALWFAHTRHRPARWQPDFSGLLHCDGHLLPNGGSLYSGAARTRSVQGGNRV